MKQYIDKSALVAEIERLIGSYKPLKTLDPTYCEGLNDSLDNILSFIDTLEVKEVKEEPVSNDLEEAVNVYIGYAPEVDECSSVYGKRQAFKAGAKWQKEQLMEKACEWLKENKDRPFIECEDPCLSGYLTDEFIEEFKKAMEE